jgi:hypothetical protein
LLVIVELVRILLTRQLLKAEKVFKNCREVMAALEEDLPDVLVVLEGMVVLEILVIDTEEAGELPDTAVTAVQAAAAQVILECLVQQAELEVEEVVLKLLAQMEIQAEAAEA